MTISINTRILQVEALIKEGGFEEQVNQRSDVQKLKGKVGSEFVYLNVLKLAAQEVMGKGVFSERGKEMAEKSASIITKKVKEVAKTSTAEVAQASQGNEKDIKRKPSVLQVFAGLGELGQPSQLDVQGEGSAKPAISQALISQGSRNVSQQARSSELFEVSLTTGGKTAIQNLDENTMRCLFESLQKGEVSINAPVVIKINAPDGKSQTFILEPTNAKNELEEGQKKIFDTEKKGEIEHSELLENLPDLLSRGQREIDEPQEEKPSSHAAALLAVVTSPLDLGSLPEMKFTKEEVEQLMEKEFGSELDNDAERTQWMNNNFRLFHVDKDEVRKARSAKKSEDLPAVENFPKTMEEELLLNNSPEKPSVGETGLNKQPEKSSRGPVIKTAAGIAAVATVAVVAVQNKDALYAAGQSALEMMSSYGGSLLGHGIRMTGNLMGMGNTVLQNASGALQQWKDVKFLAGFVSKGLTEELNRGTAHLANQAANQTVIAKWLMEGIANDLIKQVGEQVGGARQMIEAYANQLAEKSAENIAHGLVNGVNVEYEVEQFAKNLLDQAEFYTRGAQWKGMELAGHASESVAPAMPYVLGAQWQGAKLMGQGSEIAAQMGEQVRGVQWKLGQAHAFVSEIRDNFDPVDARTALSAVGYIAKEAAKIGAKEAKVQALAVAYALAKKANELKAQGLLKGMAETLPPGSFGVPYSF